MAYKLLMNCLACGAHSPTQVVNLGKQPLANSFMDKPQELPRYFLDLRYCSDCTHTQLGYAVDPELLYKDYKYVSGTTETLKTHFAALVQDVMYDYTQRKSRSSMPCNIILESLSVLDIGCNDGTLLEAFRKAGHAVSGVDPAENLRAITKEKDIDVLVDYWNADTGFKLTKEYDVITALNCLAHNSDPYGFLLGCTRIMSSRTVLIVEFPYFGNTLKLNDLGQIYAEHHSYFSAKSMAVLAERAGLTITDTKEFPHIHGGTVRFVMKRTNEAHCASLKTMIKKEEIWRDLWTFKHTLIKLQDDLDARLTTCESKVVAYGASAKSSTLFNLEGMKNVAKKIEYVVDDSPLKQGLFCPGSNIPIKAPEALLNEDKSKLLILLTVHNFKKEVLERLKKLGLSGVPILNYTPEIALEIV